AATFMLLIWISLFMWAGPSLLRTVVLRVSLVMPVLLNALIWLFWGFFELLPFFGVSAFARRPYDDAPMGPVDYEDREVLHRLQAAQYALSGQSRRERLVVLLVTMQMALMGWVTAVALLNAFRLSEP